MASIQKDPSGLVIYALGYIFPFLWRFSRVGQLQQELGAALEEISSNLLENANEGLGAADKSIIGILGMRNLL